MPSGAFVFQATDIIVIVFCRYRLIRNYNSSCLHTKLFALFLPKRARSSFDQQQVYYPMSRSEVVWKTIKHWFLMLKHHLVTNLANIDIQHHLAINAKSIINVKSNVFPTLD